MDNQNLVTWVDGERGVLENADFDLQMIRESLNFIETGDDDEVRVTEAESDATEELDLGPWPSTETTDDSEASKRIVGGEDEAASILARTKSSADSILKGVIQCILKPVKAFTKYYSDFAMLSDLIFLYHRNLVNVFGEEPLPREVAEIFDTILNKSGPPKSNSAARREDLSLSVLHLDSHFMKQLRELMNVTLDLIREIAIVSYKADESFATNGRLIYGTPHHFVWTATNHELIRCMKSFEVIATRTLELQSTVQTDDLPALKMDFDYNYTLFTDSHEKDIYSCIYTRMKEFCLDLYLKTLRFTAYISFFVCLDIKNEDFSSSLGILTSDTIIVLKNTEKAVASFISIFEELIRIKEKSDIKLAEENPELPSYSIESRIRRHSGMILDWNSRFAHLMQTTKEVARQLDLFDPYSEEYQKLKDDLDKLYLTSEESASQLNDLLFTHRDYLNVLRSKGKNSQASFDNPPYIREEPLATANLSNERLVSAHGQEEEEETEFESAGMACAKSENEREENRDEVFYGMSSSNDQDEKTMQFDEDGADVRSRQSSMKGVIKQLKTILAPVQKTMRKREQLAEKTVMGANVSDLYSLYEESEVSSLEFGLATPVSPFAGPSSSNRPVAVEKPSDRSNSPSTIDEATDEKNKSVLSFPSRFDIMMELKSKLPRSKNQTEGDKGMAQEVFGGSGAESSEDEDK